MKIKLTNCKLGKKIQLKLLEFFVLEVTARTAADLLEIHHNSAALFFIKVHKIISYHLEIEAFEIFDGEIELDETPTLAIVTDIKYLELPKSYFNKPYI